jgi:hypothetical protein
MNRRGFLRGIGLGAVAAVFAPKAIVEALEPAPLSGWDNIGTGGSSALEEVDFFYQANAYVTRNGVMIDYENKTISLTESRPYTLGEIHTSLATEWQIDEDARIAIRNGGWYE